MQHALHKHVPISCAQIVHTDIHNLHWYIASTPIEKQREQNPVWIQQVEVAVDHHICRWSYKLQIYYKCTVIHQSVDFVFAFYRVQCSNPFDVDD